ncbi:MAG: bifunctional precorrin-2 dehydrogenase/sirohydrochlorin ferrochelatase [Planctomycetaceae bacterium]|nr:bifunctional precorrin-2 dehydrogenase/sirohydrochlorin ferrochelatase [Planctomycetaceae bacterium]
MSKLAIYLEMEGRRAVVVGGGTVSARKVYMLAQSGARVTVVAEHVASTLLPSFQIPQVELIIASYSKDYLVGATLAVAATNDLVLNRRVYEDCQELEVLCNVVDQPELCDFYMPAVIQRGHLQVAIGTDGQCPAYAGHLRKKLEEIFTEQHGRFLEQLECIRARMLDEIPDPDQRKSILSRLVSDESFEIFHRDGPGRWRQFAEEQLHQPSVG